MTVSCIFCNANCVDLTHRFECAIEVPVAGCVLDATTGGSCPQGAEQPTVGGGMRAPRRGPSDAARRDGARRAAALVLAAAIAGLLLATQGAAAAKPGPEEQARIDAIFAQLPQVPPGAGARRGPSSDALSIPRDSPARQQLDGTKPCKPKRVGMPKKSGNERKTSKYLEAVRGSEASLAQFFRLMPKAGDIHIHFTGTVPTEDLMATAVRANLSLCTAKGTPSYGYVTPDPQTFAAGVDSCGAASNWYPLATPSGLSGGELTGAPRQIILESWSIYNFPENAASRMAAAKHFFDVFFKFDAAVKALEADKAERQGALQRMKKELVANNVQFLEMMYDMPFGLITPDYFTNVSATLRQLAAAGNPAALEAYIAQVLDGPAPADANVPGSVATSVALAEEDALAISDDTFELRWQFHAVRAFEPASVLMQLLACFLIDVASPWVVGTNLVAREDDAVPLLDYTLHMHMLRVLRSRHPTAGVAIHAGELTPALVTPEDMAFHVTESVGIARTQRVGHGVSLPWETKMLETLGVMRSDQIAVEINLDSNRFILGVDADRHPLQLYLAGCVPVVISSDDAGLLRSSLIQNYVLLAKQHEYIKYPSIKQMVYDTIRFAFFPDASKERIKAQVDQKFKEFEAAVAKVKYFKDNGKINGH
ncbi:MAG: hypothetical protein J3K34DRAFT_458385 [Monoraphidium minutum]|nr:MAG: hypothetical protein J3K34DRAFT_458385 [Monoraphidium minutum]